MKRRKFDCIWFAISVVSFLLLAVSFLLMPIGETDGGLTTYSIIAGVMFWSSLVLGTASQMILSHRRKMWYVINKVRRARHSRKIGLISFFENVYAGIADVTFIISLIGLVVVLIVTQGTGYICYILMAALVFSFAMHCILNGKIYYHIVNQNKILQAEKSKSENR